MAQMLRQRPLTPAFELARQLKDKGVLKSSSLGGGDSAGHIAIQTKGMQELCRSHPSPIQTDSIEGFTESYFYKGEINVTVSSCYDPMLRTQAPMLISVLFSKNTESYKMHWSMLHGDIPGNTEEEYLQNFPGNTSDFSDAIRLGFVASLQDLLVTRFQSETKVDAPLMEGMYRLCEVHYKRNLTKVANISKAVPPEDRSDFYKRGVGLLSPDLTFDDFKEDVTSMVRKYPLAASWITWYLHAERAGLIFPACKDMPKEGLLNVLRRMKPDTNAQEGLGGFIQGLKGYKKTTLHETLHHLAAFCLTYDRMRKSEVEGTPTRYRRANKNDKKQGREKESNYKAPETSKRLISQSLGHTTNCRADGLSLPAQMTNLGNTCYASSLVQCCASSDVLLDFFLKNDCCNHFNCAHPFRLFKELVSEVAIASFPTVIKPTAIPKMASLCGYDKFSSEDPLLLLGDLLQNSILEGGESDPEPLFRGGSLIQQDRCTLVPCSDGSSWPARAAVDGGIALQLGIPTDAVSIQQCIDHHFEVETVPDHVCLLCGMSGGMERKYIFPKMKQDDKWVLILKLNTHVFAPSGVEGDNRQFHRPNHQADVVVPNLQIELTEFMEEKQHVIGNLLSYISFIPSGATKGSNDEEATTGGVPSGHYTSVTRCNNSNTFVTSDDLTPSKPRTIGASPNRHWPVPSMLFYLVDAKGADSPDAQGGSDWADSDSAKKRTSDCTTAAQHKREEIAFVDDGESTSSQVTSSSSGSGDESSLDELLAADSEKWMKDASPPVPSIIGIGPPMTTLMAEFADKVRNHKYKGKKGNYMLAGKGPFGLLPKELGGLSKKVKRNEKETSTPGKGLFVVDEESKAYEEARTAPTNGCSWSSMNKLADNELISEETVNCMASLFNKEEREKTMNDPCYDRPCHMFSSFFLGQLIEGLAVDNNKPVQFAKLRYTPERVKRWREVRLVGDKEDKGIFDLFNCRKLFFPYHKPGHWVLIEVDLEAFNVNFLCSLHRKASKIDMFVAEKVVRFLHETHVTWKETQPTFGKELDFSENFEASPRTLLHAHQGATVDCGLHMLTNAFLRAANVNDTSALGAAGAGAEMRRRVVVSLQRGEVMFRPLRGESTHVLLPPTGGGGKGGNIC